MAASVGPVPATSDEVTPVAEAAPSFEAFSADNHARLYTALCLVTGSRHEAEEVMQEALVRVWERWEKVGRLDAPTGYLYRAAMNLAPSRYRLHGARHSYAELAVSSGVRLDVVSRTLGHSSSAFTADQYSHDSDEAAAEAADRIGALLRG
jgi:DNA-directed RNA polymerase specialized sigma24 family protein